MENLQQHPTIWRGPAAEPEWDSSSQTAVIGQRVMVQIKREKIRSDNRKIFFIVRVETLEEVAQRSFGWPNPVRLQWVVGWGIEQLTSWEVFLSMAEALELDDHWGLFQPNYFMVLWFWNQNRRLCKPTWFPEQALIDIELSQAHPSINFLKVGKCMQ